MDNQRFKPRFLIRFPDCLIHPFRIEDIDSPACIFLQLVFIHAQHTDYIPQMLMHIGSERLVDIISVFHYADGILRKPRQQPVCFSDPIRQYVRIENLAEAGKKKHLRVCQFRGKVLRNGQPGALLIS